MSSTSTDNNYGSKGKCFGYFMVFLILFVMLVVYIYNGNQDSVPLPK